VSTYNAQLSKNILQMDSLHLSLQIKVKRDKIQAADHSEAFTCVK